MSGQVSTGHAKVLLGVEDGRVQDQLAGEVVSKQLGVRALEARVQHLVRARQAKTRRHHPQAVFLKAAAEELTQPKMPPWALIIFRPASWNSGK